MSAAKGYLEDFVSKTYDHIIKSQSDNKIYKGFELKNGMKVLLISDSEADKAAAAMSVEVGSMSDPWEIPGLAHFCEHMLFLGTEKYPVENEYTKFIQEHGGNSNAYTSSDITCYFFDVMPNSLEGALDRFAQFFICPLFTESATDREVNAVNSEHEKNLLNDTHRLLHLYKATCNPKHDFNKFTTGNIETLSITPKIKGINVRDELLNFHKKYYSSNLMALVVLGKECLEDLEKLVIPLFSNVINRNAEIPTWPDNPFDDNHLKLKGHIVPVKDLRNLHICFPVPDLQHEYRSSPSHYVSHLVGHEGSGSVFLELRNKGWITSLVSGEKFNAPGFSLFGIDCSLTKEGLDHINEIITYMFQYLTMLKSVGPQEWIFEEMKKIEDMNFRFKDAEKPQQYTSFLSPRMFDYSMEDVVSGSQLLYDFKPDLISFYLDHFTPDNMRIAIVSHKFKNICTETEKWYGTKYKITPLSEEELKMWRNPELHPNLKLPPANNLIAEKFDLVSLDSNIPPHPILLKNTKMGRLWFKQDNKFRLPKTSVVFHLESPMAYIDPLHATMTQLYVLLVNDYFAEYTYAAKLAGFLYFFKYSKVGVLINVYGFSDKLHLFIQGFLEKLSTVKFEEERFNSLKEEMQRVFENFKAEQPHQHAIYYCSVLLADRIWSKEDLLNSMDELTFYTFQEFLPKLFARLHIESLIYGNLSAKQACFLMGLVESVLFKNMNTKYVLPSQFTKERELQLLDGCHYVYETINEIHTNTSVENYYQCGIQETRLNILLELLVSVINEPCYSILRTQDQLGYIVCSGIRKSIGVQGLRFIVQSDKPPNYIDGKIENFIEYFDKYLQDISEEEFKNHINSVSVKRLEKPKGMIEQASKYWLEILVQQYNFDRDDIEVSCLADITKEELYSFFKELIACDAPKRKKLSVQVKPAANIEFKDQNTSEVESSNEIEVSSFESFIPPPPAFRPPVKIQSISEFKSCHGLYPLVAPSIHIPSPFITIEKAKL